VIATANTLGNNSNTVFAYHHQTATQSFIRLRNVSPQLPVQPQYIDETYAQRLDRIQSASTSEQTSPSAIFGYRGAEIEASEIEQERAWKEFIHGKDQ
jgi:hypothetical protein